MGLTYRDSGVDIEKGDRFIEVVRKKLHEDERSNIGRFGGLYDLSTHGLKNPVLVSSTDGVGTKLLIAKEAKKYDTIGIDLVAMCINDVITLGAKPLFFLDYLATSNLDVEIASQVLEGIIKGCRRSGCTLLGGETAEMPGVYAHGDYELAGFAVGVVEKERIIDGTNIEAGDVLIGLASSGIHSNGLSLARKALFDQRKYSSHTVVPPLENQIIEELLIPTKIYTAIVLDLICSVPVRGIAHITGGGLYNNISRILPHRTEVKIYWEKIHPHPIFSIIQEAGDIDEEEMKKTFNMGIGMVLILGRSECDRVLTYLKDRDEPVSIIGEVETAMN